MNLLVVLHVAILSTSFDHLTWFRESLLSAPPREQREVTVEREPLVLVVPSEQCGPV